jgi:hypothetical protein
VSAVVILFVVWVVDGDNKQRSWSFPSHSFTHVSSNSWRCRTAVVSQIELLKEILSNVLIFNYWRVDLNYVAAVDGVYWIEIDIGANLNWCCLLNVCFGASVNGGKFFILSWILKEKEQRNRGSMEGFGFFYLDWGNCRKRKWCKSGYCNFQLAMNKIEIANLTWPQKKRVEGIKHERFSGK